MTVPPADNTTASDTPDIASSSSTQDPSKSKFKKVMAATAAPAGDPLPLPAPYLNLLQLPTEVEPAAGSRGNVARMENAKALIAALGVEVIQEIRQTNSVAGARIEIQFNSKTLEGLQVNIAMQQGKLTVDMTPASDRVAQLLAANLGDLNQNLAAAGLRNVSVSVKAPPRRAGRRPANRARVQR